MSTPIPEHMKLERAATATKGSAGTSEAIVSKGSASTTSAATAPAGSAEKSSAATAPTGSAGKTSSPCTTKDSPTQNVTAGKNNGLQLPPAKGGASKGKEAMKETGKRGKDASGQPSGANKNTEKGHDNSGTTQGATPELKASYLDVARGNAPGAAADTLTPPSAVTATVNDGTAPNSDTHTTHQAAAASGSMPTMDDMAARQWLDKSDPMALEPPPLGMIVCDVCNHIIHGGRLALQMHKLTSSRCRAAAGQGAAREPCAQCGKMLAAGDAWARAQHTPYSYPTRRRSAFNDGWRGESRPTTSYDGWRGESRPTTSHSQPTTSHDDGWRGEPLPTPRHDGWRGETWPTTNYDAWRRGSPTTNHDGWRDDFWRNESQPTTSHDDGWRGEPQHDGWRGETWPTTSYDAWRRESPTTNHDGWHGE